MQSLKTKINAAKTAMKLGDISLAVELIRGTGYAIVEHSDYITKILFTDNKCQKMVYVVPVFYIDGEHGKRYSLVKVPHNTRWIGSRARKIAYGAPLI